MKKVFLFCAVLLSNVAWLQAQNSLLIEEGGALLHTTDMSGYANLSSEDFFDLDSTQLASLFATRTSEITVYLQIPSIENVNTIHLKLGRVSAAQDIGLYHLAYSGINLPSGVSIETIEDKVYIKVGNFASVTACYLEAWLEDASGNVSPIYSSNNQ